MSRSKSHDPSRTDRLLKAAIEYAERGIPVFPVYTVEPNGTCTCRKKSDCPDPGKHPVTANGLNDATTDLNQIKRWWSKNPHNIGAVPSEGGYVVFDVDPWKDGEDDRLEHLRAEHGDLPDTLVIASGEHDGTRGHHYWYRNSMGLVIRKAKIAGIDLRRGQAYVLMPPSRHVSGVEYEIESGTLDEVAEMPDWIASAGKRQEPQVEVRGARQVTGIPVGKRALKTIDAGFLPEPRDGHSQRDEAVALARNLIESGTDRGLARGLFEKVLLDPRSNLDPDRPWTLDDATSIFSSVAWNPAPDHGEFISRASGIPERFKFLNLADAYEIAQEEIDWVVPELISAGDQVLIAGPPKALKTWFMLHMLKAIAYQSPVLGRTEWTPAGDQRILVVEEEGARNRWAKRLMDVFPPGIEVPVEFGHKLGFNLLDERHVKWLISEAKQREARILTIDPWQRVTAGVKENDAAATGPAWDAIHHIALETNAALILIHHSNKGNGELTLDSIRGSSRMAGEIDLGFLLRKVALGELELFLEGRDLVLEDDTDRFGVTYDREMPANMRIIGPKLNTSGPIKTTKAAVAQILTDAAPDWLTTAQIEREVAESLGAERSQESIRDALRTLRKEGQAESKPGSGGNKAHHWRRIG